FAFSIFGMAMVKTIFIIVVNILGYMGLNKDIIEPYSRLTGEILSYIFFYIGILTYIFVYF
ncbi:hypothetical protein LAV45_16850, partial [Clostridium sporogenes]|nr:hypothetical protein [Clostridium sporogenes]